MNKRYQHSIIHKKGYDMRSHNKWWILLVFALLTLGGVFSESVFAQTSTLCLNAQNLGTDVTTATTIGTNIVTAIFTTIQNIMTSVSQKFYTGIVGNQDFKSVVSDVIIVYMGIYGVMILFGLAPATGREAVKRLIKIGIVWSLLGNGQASWSFFNDYIGNLFIGGMNELITQFATAGMSSVTSSAISLNATTGAVTLSSTALSNIFEPLGLVMGQKFIVTIFSLASVCPYGVIMSMFLTFGLVEFILMLVGVVLTYIKSIVGLSFLFGIAPIFIIMLLFGKSKQIFFGWLNQVISFALTPVMLFAFLSFYIQLIQSAITGMIYTNPQGGSLDYCWTKWITAGQYTIDWWRPKLGAGATNSSGDWDCQKNPPPVSITDILYFGILCYLGKTFGTFVEGLAQNISGGVGPGAEKVFSAMDTIKDKATQGLKSMADRGNVQNAQGKASANTGKR